MSVLGIDTTFNLCNLWVTDSCYRNKRLVNNVSGENPNFLAPSLFHFTKDEQTFRRFAVELLANPRLANLKKIGVDMEEAIYNGLSSLLPNVEKLHCVRHLKQRDEAQIIKILNKFNGTELQINKIKKDILDDIYGQRMGGVYEYGLTESTDKEEFLSKLESCKRKWNANCNGFYDWFIQNRNQIDSYRPLFIPQGQVQMFVGYFTKMMSIRNISLKRSDKILKRNPSKKSLKILRE